MEELGAAFREMPAPSWVVPAVPEVEATGEANAELAAAAMVQCDLVGLSDAAALDAITCCRAFVVSCCEVRLHQAGAFEAASCSSGNSNIIHTSTWR